MRYDNILPFFQGSATKKAGAMLRLFSNIR